MCYNAVHFTNEVGITLDLINAVSEPSLQLLKMYAMGPSLGRAVSRTNEHEMASTCRRVVYLCAVMGGEVVPHSSAQVYNR